MTKTDRTFAQLRRAITQTSDPNDRRIYEAMMLLAAAFAWGTDIARLVERTGLPMDFVAGVAARLRAVDLWTDHGLDTREWWDEHGDLVGTVLFEQALLGLGE
jgi:hypothetical protein